MLRVTIELFPFGNIEGSKIIAVGKISQIIDSEEGSFRNYEGEFFSDMDGEEFALIKNHNRELGPWDLLRKLLIAANK